METVVRDGKKVWPTCPECGCRLGFFAGALSHWHGYYNKDARGHACSLINSWWKININHKLERL